MCDIDVVKWCSSLSFVGSSCVLIIIMSVDMPVFFFMRSFEAENENASVLVLSMSYVVLYLYNADAGAVTRFLYYDRALAPR